MFGWSATTQALKAAAVLALLLAVGASSEPSFTEDLTSSFENYDEIAQKLRRMNGQSGEFEGVYQSGFESGTFWFCDNDECPNMTAIDCHPKFSDAAAAALQGFWRNYDRAPIHMFAKGRIRTGDIYGPDEQYCEIAIESVRAPRVIDVPYVRSVQFPELTVPDTVKRTSTPPLASSAVEKR